MSWFSNSFRAGFYLLLDSRAFSGNIFNLILQLVPECPENTCLDKERLVLPWMEKRLPGHELTVGSCLEWSTAWKPSNGTEISMSCRPYGTNWL